MNLRSSSTPHRLAGVIFTLLLASTALPALAETGESTVDKIADVMAIIVLCVVPIVGVALFLMVHVLPEKIAHKRHHPQRDAITTLCLLSLVFGGLLWPLAWLWAFTKPVGYRTAYGTDKHEDYYEEMAVEHQAGRLSDDQVAHLVEDLDSIQAKGPLPPHLKKLREELARRQRAGANATVAATSATSATTPAAAVIAPTPVAAPAEKGQA